MPSRGKDSAADPGGNGVIKPGTRLVSIQVDSDGEQWVCDHDVDPRKDFREQGCVASKEIRTPSDE